MSEHQDDAGGLDLNDLAAALYRNILATSNTARGEEVSKARPGKVRLGITGAALASKVQSNTSQVAAIIVKAVEERWSVGKTIQAVIETTHEGFPREARSWRKAPTNERWGRVNYHKIPREVRRFKRALGQNLDRWDPVRLAAWAEWMWDEHIHPLGDGCGRTAKAIGMWVLIRSDLPLPDYRSRGAYYTAMAEGLRTFTKYYRLCVWGELGARRPPKRAPARESGIRDPQAGGARLRRAS